MTKAQRDPSIIDELTAYLSKYVVVTDDAYKLTVACWVVATYLWEYFDAFAYLSITAATKQAGKSRMGQLISYVSRNGRYLTNPTPPTLFVMIANRKLPPTIVLEEAEGLSSEAASAMREILNAGYENGATVPRVERDEAGDKMIVENPVYSAKAFITIADVNDTLRSRSIVITMVRAPANRPEVSGYRRGVAIAEADELKEKISTVLGHYKKDIVDYYQRMPPLSFLVNDRDAQIWQGVFAVCHILAPEHEAELTRIAADLSTEKMASARKFNREDIMGAERSAQFDESRVRFIRDLLLVIKEHGRTLRAYGGKAATRYVFTADVLRELYALPSAPWRKYKVSELTAIQAAQFLQSFGVKATIIQDRTLGKVLRGYREDVVQAAYNRFIAGPTETTEQVFEDIPDDVPMDDV